ncbi:uncharacterized protein LOC108683208 [Hyalella azteca]|uniref:Uncharacterized protein LOC108683208 n=1 Tax=Hyalella azteca TaxID=294128 RepID=A0A8B7PR90_HYAAZ|nr:uncharacterized protein LOC108683208 [Hyalella azteca]
MSHNCGSGVTSAGGVYVKAQLVPAEWFPDAPLDRKTSVCKEDPAVYDEEITYGSVRPDSPGVERGGFLLLRLKLTRRLRSQVMSEALVSLSDVPVLSPENRRSKPHTHLVLTRAAPLHSYESLNILRRRNDEVTRQFLQQLEHDNKGQAKAFMSASNASISSLW